MRPYFGSPWTDSHQIWAVDVFHRAPPIYGIQNAEMKKEFFFKCHRFCTLLKEMLPFVLIYIKVGICKFRLILLNQITTWLHTATYSNSLPALAQISQMCPLLSKTHCRCSRNSWKEAGKKKMYLLYKWCIFYDHIKESIAHLWSQLTSNFYLKPQDYRKGRFPFYTQHYSNSSLCSSSTQQ